MHRRLVAIGGLALVMALVVPGPATVRAAAPDLHPRLIATLPSGAYGSFGESLAVSGSNLYVSLTVWSPDEFTPNEGQIWKIGPTGKLARFGPSLAVCLLTGLAFDNLGRLYVGTYSCDAGLEDVQASGVLRINSDGTITRILTVPAGSFPNGLAFHDGDLYVSDFMMGEIWQVPQGEIGLTPSTPWLQSSLLAPQRGTAGVNGIAFWGDTLYAVTYFGSIVQIPVGSDGTAGTPTVLTRDHRLVESDGVAFDSMGRLWVSANTGSVVRVDRTGAISVVVDGSAWLDYPAQPAFGTTARDATTLYVVNGSYYVGTPNVVAFDVGVTGERLP